MSFAKFLTLLAAGSALAAPAPAPATESAPLEKRGQQIGHDQVRVIPESLPNDAIGRTMKRFQPWVNTEGPGCWPYPAVDTDGNWSGGLAIGGSQAGGCTNSVGQAYVRGAWYNGIYALMYSYYFPKDQSAIGGGHRNDWEGMVVWVNNPAVENPVILGGSVSGHGKFDNTQSIPSWAFTSDGHPMCRYYVDVAVFGTHRFGWTGDRGGLHPLVNWEQLSPAAQDALQNTNWGSADFPLSYNFQSNLAKAYPF